MAEKNIEMNVMNESGGYDVLYPKTTPEQAGSLSIGGGTMQGDIILSEDSSNEMGVVSKSYVNNSIKTNVSMTDDEDFNFVFSNVYKNNNELVLMADIPPFNDRTLQSCYDYDRKILYGIAFPNITKLNLLTKEYETKTFSELNESSNATKFTIIDSDGNLICHRNYNAWFKINFNSETCTQINSLPQPTYNYYPTYTINSQGKFFNPSTRGTITNNNNVYEINYIYTNSGSVSYFTIYNGYVYSICNGVYKETFENFMNGSLGDLIVSVYTTEGQKYYPQNPKTQKVYFLGDGGFNGVIMKYSATSNIEYYRALPGTPLLIGDRFFCCDMDAKIVFADSSCTNQVSDIYYL